MKRRRITALLLIFMFMSYTSAVFSQQQNVKLNGKNLTLKMAFDQIEKQTGLSVDYDAKTIDVTTTIVPTPKPGDVKNVLDKLLEKTNYIYTINKSHIIITIQEKSSPASGNLKETTPRKNISGIVTDENSEPVIGATVVLDGVNKGTITDNNGKFDIEAPLTGKLIVSYIGYQTTEFPIKGKTDLNITLKENVNSLDEVVVVGYGTMKKRDLTGAVSSVKMSDVPVGTVSTISHMLAGTAAGLQVNTISAQPGGQADLKIRGAASVGAGNEPLIVIDGFPVSSSGEPASGNRYEGGAKDFILSSLNPNDIESIEILKDASATAIYGARAGHGVIIITTKRGKQGAPTVTYSATSSMQILADKYKMLNAKEYMIEGNRYVRDKYMIDNRIYPYGTRSIDDFPGIDNISIYTQDEINNPLYDTDWLGEITRTGMQNQHNIAINGGNESTQYQASLSYFNQDGVIKNNGMTRYSGRINMDQRISKYVKIGISNMLNQNTFDNVPLGSGTNEYSGIIRSAIQFTPLLPIKDENGDYVLSQLRGFIPNPVSLLEITDRTIDERVLSTYYLEFTPISDLKFRINAGVDRKFRKRSAYLPKTTLYGKNANGDASIRQYDDRDYLWETTVNYSKKFNRHNLNLLAGHSYQIFNSEGFSAGNKDFVTDSYLYNNLGAGEFSKPTVNSWANISSMASIFGRINYSYLDRYLLTMTLRADGASNLAPGHQWGYFPSIATAWRFSDEEFMGNFKKILSNGKLRVSYGETGNSNIGNGAIDYYKSSMEYVFGENAYRGVEIGQIGNKDLTWETTKEWNFGLDIGFYDRINISAEYFDRSIVDLLNARSLMSYYPIATLADNIGTTQSRGVEVTINIQNIKTRNFDWNSTITYSFYRDRWKERADSWKPASYEKYNDPIRSLYGYLSDGLIQPGDLVPHMPGSLPGQVRIKDIDSYQRDENDNIMVDASGIPLKTGVPDGKLDDADKVFYGTYDPDFILGFSNSFKYKSWDMSVYIYGVFNKLMNHASYYDSWALGSSNILNDNNLPTSVKNIWRSDNMTSKLPGYTQVQSQYGIGDLFTKKISFVRVRNITLGYNFKFNKIISNLRCYADVNNPIMFTNYNGIDPETDDTEVSYPNVRTFSLGIEIKF